MMDIPVGQVVQGVLAALGAQAVQEEGTADKVLVDMDDLGSVVSLQQMAAKEN